MKLALTAKRKHKLGLNKNWLVLSKTKWFVTSVKQRNVKSVKQNN
ncbi:hypothetical protein VEx25_0458 [Vibrio antiquarius]|uniref:Uncharacterized protein n=1 Tax=Vibrio antiquarius (strain Ex25) TaxID=150340 RepID=A0ABM9WWF6_VIBAE|nr:hypothetical protein VEx25_0458 [Vibrio antiquarius]